jgi:chromosomal replication initiation ATPase DnaA
MSALAPLQLVLDLPHRAALGAEDFLVSPSNAAAVTMIDGWREWPRASALVVGPKRSGKSHLAHVWRFKTGAEVIEAADLSEADAARFSGPLLVENVDRGLRDERALFYLLNLAREHGQGLLITSARPPGELDIALPDLRSRLRALPLITIGAPDGELLRAVLVKLFADRQLAVEPHVIAHLALHMEQSMAAANRIVAEIDRRSLAAHRRVSRALASEVLAEFGNAD